MFSPMMRLALGLSVVGFFGFADEARAQAAPPPGAEEPALQGSLEAAHASGYAGAWASTLGDAGRADVEVDLYGGWSGDVGAATLDVGVLGYVYPDGSNLDYLEA